MSSINVSQKLEITCPDCQEIQSIILNKNNNTHDCTSCDTTMLFEWEEDFNNENIKEILNDQTPTYILNDLLNKKYTNDSYNVNNTYNSHRQPQEPPSIPNNKIEAFRNKTIQNETVQNYVIQNKPSPKLPYHNKPIPQEPPQNEIVSSFKQQTHPPLNNNRIYPKNNNTQQTPIDKNFSLKNTQNFNQHNSPLLPQVKNQFSQNTSGLNVDLKLKKNNNIPNAVNQRYKHPYKPIPKANANIETNSSTPQNNYLQFANQNPQDNFLKQLVSKLTFNKNNMVIGGLIIVTIFIISYLTLNKKKSTPTNAKKTYSSDGFQYKNNPIYGIDSIEPDEKNAEQFQESISLATIKNEAEKEVSKNKKKSKTFNKTNKLKYNKIKQSSYSNKSNSNRYSDINNYKTYLEKKIQKNKTSNRKAE